MPDCEQQSCDREACINLVEKFSHLYRITWDEAYDPKGIPLGKRDPWYAQIPCKYGVIYPHGGNTLALEIDYHTRLARSISKLEGVVVHQCGDQEMTLLFPLRLFDQVAEIVQPRKKRKLSEEHKAILAASNEPHRFKGRRFPEQFSAP